MLRLLPISAVIFVGVGLLAQTSAPSPDRTDEHPASPCVVAGRVVTAADGTPLKSARVALVSERPRKHRQMYATTSDSEGRFLLKDVEQGRYQFFATHPGFVDQHYQAKGDEDGAPLSLRPEEKVSDVLFRMTVAAVITGRVTNEDGEAMADVQTVALRAPSEDEIEDEELAASRQRNLRVVSAARTDDRGQYRIFGLKPGEYYIRAAESFEPDQRMVGESFWVRQFLGSEYAPVYYPGVPQVSQAQVVTVKPGEEAQADVSMRRVKTVNISGRVLGLSGPAKNASVSLEQAQADDYGFDRQDTTDEKGAFRLKGVPPGSYLIVVYQRGEGDRPYEARARQKIEVAGDNIDSLNIALGLGVRFQGRVQVAGPGSITLDRIAVSLRPVDEDEQYGGYGRVKKDGTFEITSVQDGNYAVNVWGLEDNWYLKSVRLGPDDILAEGLHLEKGVSGGRLEVSVSSASAQLEGSVGDADGPVIGARIRAVPDPETPYNRSRSRSSRTDQTGRFLLAGLTPGKYRVFARSPVSSEGSSHKSEPQFMTLSENDHQTLQIKLVKPQD